MLMIDLPIPFQSASQLLQLLERMAIISREPLDLYLARVETYNPKYNAVVALDTDKARKAAEAIDEARAHREQLGPLAGVPITIKDSFEVAGMPTTCGLPPLANFTPNGMPMPLSDSGAPVQYCSAKPMCPPVCAAGKLTIRSMAS